MANSTLAWTRQSAFGSADRCPPRSPRRPGRVNFVCSGGVLSDRPPQLGECKPANLKRFSWQRLFAMPARLSPYPHVIAEYSSDRLAGRQYERTACPPQFVDTNSLYRRSVLE